MFCIIILNPVDTRAIIPLHNCSRISMYRLYHSLEWYTQVRIHFVTIVLSPVAGRSSIDHTSVVYCKLTRVER